MNNTNKFKNIRITKENLHKVRASPNDIPKGASRTYAMQALMNGYRDVVVKLVKQDKIDFNAKDKKGRSLIHYAVRSKDKDLIELLIKKRISINVRDSKGKTPVFQFFDKKVKITGDSESQESDVDLDFATWLVEHGADANINDNKGNMPLHIAAKWHSVNTVSFLLNVTKQADKPNYTGLRPIHYASQKNSLAVVQKILHHRVDVLATDNRGGNILHHALENSSDNVIKFLLKETKAVQMLNKQDIEQKQTPFQKAVFGQKLDVVYQMIGLGGDVNKKNNNNNNDTPLGLAVKSKSIEMVEMLLSSGADITNKSVLYDSIVPYGDDDIFNLLMDYSPDVDAINNQGKTPLMKALELSKNSIVRKLLDSGADIFKLSDNKKNILFFLGDSCSDDILRELIKKGVDVKHVAKDGNTILHEIIVGQYKESHIKILIENGADVNTRDKYGRILLHHILMYNADIGLAECLIDAGADIKIKTESNTTILHMVSGSDGAHEGLLQKIIDTDGQDVNYADDSGNTALHFAVSGGDIENVKILLENGADPYIENNFYESPLLLSQRYFNKDVAKVILDFEKNKKAKSMSDKFNKDKKPSNQNNKKPPKGFGGGSIV